MQGASSLEYVTAGVSDTRLARHLCKVLSSTVTNAISSGKICPELNELGFVVDKVSMLVL